MVIVNWNKIASYDCTKLFAESHVLRPIASQKMFQLACNCEGLSP